MEIVVNKCYGGFSISLEAENLYAEKAGFKIYRYKQDGGLKGLYRKTKALMKDRGAFTYTFKQDQGDSFASWPKGKDTGYWYSRDIERNDLNLIAVVKELGVKASGSCASLSITEIPDGVNWEIDEYDGMEIVREKHRSW